MVRHGPPFGSVAILAAILIPCEHASPAHRAWKAGGAETGGVRQPRKFSGLAPMVTTVVSSRVAYERLVNRYAWLSAFRVTLLATYERPT